MESSEAVQEVPSQCVSAPHQPTAQTSVAEEPETEYSLDSFGEHQVLDNDIHDNDFNPWPEDEFGDGSPCPGGIGGQIAVFDQVGSGTTITGNLIHDSEEEAGVSLGGSWGNCVTDCTVIDNWIWSNAGGAVNNWGDSPTNVIEPNTEHAP